MATYDFGVWAAKAQQETDAGRLERMDRALRAYKGTLPKTLAIPPKGVDDNIFVPYPRLFVNKSASALFGDDLDFQVAAEGYDGADADLDDAWPPAERGRHLIRLGINGGIFGDLYTRIIIRPNGTPRVVLPDPLNVEMECDPADYETIVVWREMENSTDSAGRPITRKRETTPENGVWVTRTYESATNSTVWVEIADPEIWPFPWSPYTHAQNLPAPNEVYGLPDLTDDVVTMSTALARLDSICNRTARIHAFPKPVVTGVRKNSFDWAADRPVFLDNLDQKIEYLETSGTPAEVLQFRRDLSQYLHEVVQIPEITLRGAEGIGAVSGVALKILYGPLIQLTNTKRREAAPLLTETVGKLLEVRRGQRPPVTIGWPDILPFDDEAAARTGTMLDQLGVISKRTLAERLKLDYETELERMAAEEEAARDREMQAANAVPGDPFEE